MGVADHTGLLAPGEVFVQLERDHDGKVGRVVTGDVLITRHPCYEPSDIVKVWSFHPHIAYLQRLRKDSRVPLKNIVCILLACARTCLFAGT